MQDDAYGNRPQKDHEISTPHMPLINLCMETWAARWRILPTGSVGCVICCGAQVAGDAWLPFAHDLGCLHQGVTVQQPWLYLRAHLMRIAKQRVV